MSAPTRSATRCCMFLALLALAGCNAAPETDTGQPEVIAPERPADPLQKAQEAAGDFSSQLRAALREHMGIQGPVSALDFCHDQAPEIAQDVMARHGLRLGRVAVPGRERNPAHAAAPWQQAVLARFAEAVADGQAPEDQVAIVTDDLPDGVALRMMRGIRVEPQCQICHGVELAPGIADTVARLYPGDRAIGFLEGDLRGALWVEVPLATDEQGARP